MPKKFLLPILCLMTLTACGFHLRSDAKFAPQMRHIELDGFNIAKAQRLQALLMAQLSDLHIDVSERNAASDAVHVRLLHFIPQYHVLNGRLTEVELGLMVTFDVTDAQGQTLLTPRTLWARRSYQRNLASINVDSQEETLLTAQLYDDMAGQIMRQLGQIGHLPLQMQPAP